MKPQKIFPFTSGTDISPHITKKGLGPFLCFHMLFSGLRSEVMLHRPGEFLPETGGCLLTDLPFGNQHVEGVHVGVIYVRLRRNTRFLQEAHILQRLTVKGFPFSHKGVGGRKPGIIRLMCRRSVGGEIFPVRAPQIEIPPDVVSSGVPHPAVIVPGGRRVMVIQHGIQGHLKGDLYFAPVPRHHAQRRGESAARALAAHHDLVIPGAEPGSVLFQIEKGLVAVLDGGGIRRAQRQPVARGDHQGAEPLHQVDGTAHMDHLLHSEDVSSTVDPENGRSRLLLLFRAEDQERYSVRRPFFCPDILVRLQTEHCFRSLPG